MQISAEDTRIQMSAKESHRNEKFTRHSAAAAAAAYTV